MNVQVKCAAAVMLLLVATCISAGQREVGYDDVGVNSLRQAILDANSGACEAPCQIRFGTGGLLAPVTALPIVTADGVSIVGIKDQTVIDGSLAGSRSGMKVVGARDVHIEKLALVNFRGHGIFLDHVRDTDVQDIWAGVDPRDYRPGPNHLDGIAVRGSSGVAITGVHAGSNLGSGIYIADSTDVYVGTCEVGRIDQLELSRPNGAWGVFITNSTGCRVSSCTIAHNQLSGLGIEGSSSRVQVDIFNQFFDNGLLGVQFLNGANLDIPPPLITSAVRSNHRIEISMEVNATPGAGVYFALFVSKAPNEYQAGQVIRQVGSSSGHADAEGRLRFDFSVVDDTAEWFVAQYTLYDGTQGYSSPFSRPARVVDSDLTFHVTSLEDTGPGTLRQAIEASANAGCRATLPCRIDFLTDGTIEPRSPLPLIESSGLFIDASDRDVTLDGSKQAVGSGLRLRQLDHAFGGPFILVRGLTIRGFADDGVEIDSEDGIRYSITRVDGCSIIDNGRSGISVTRAAVRLGTYPSPALDFLGGEQRGNLVAGNRGDGLRIGESATVLSASNQIERNGQAGILVDGGRFNSTYEHIAYNGGYGVRTISGRASVGQSSIHDNWLKAIDAGVDTRPTVLSARFDPIDNVTTIRVLLDVEPIRLRNLYSSSHPNSFGIAENPIPWNIIRWHAEGPDGTTWVARVFADLTGQLISATAVRFDGFLHTEIGPTSEVSNETQVTTDECAPPLVPLTLSPEPDAPQSEGEPVRFAWTPVGAVSYKLWVRKRRGEPLLHATVSTGEASALLEPGEYEWWVEAVSSTCHSSFSRPQRFAVEPKG